jgi:alkylation response protein AidB-like acyl-CoA dehydrogenase
VWERTAPFLDAVAGFLVERVLPLEGRFLAQGFGAVAEELEGVRAEARRRGLAGPQLPRELGGVGLGFLEHAFVSELLGVSPLGHYALGCQAPDAGNLELLRDFASPAQRERYLLPLARGEVRSCFAMTEPGRAGSNPVWLDTRAVPEGDGWVLSGRKWFASSADGAAFAVVMAVTDPEAPPHERASLFLVPTATPGFRLLRNLPVMGEAGDGWASHGEIALDGCRVEGDALLGERGRGFAMAQARLGPGRIHHAMRWLGICHRAFDLLCRRAATRELAPGEPLGRQGVVQHWIAEERAAIAAARLLVLDAADRIDRRGPDGAREEVSLVKFFVAGVLDRVLDRAIQLHGALGMTDDLPLAWFYRHERAARIYDGPDEVHKAAVGRRILARYQREPATP